MNEEELLNALLALDLKKEAYLFLIKGLEREIENHRTEIMGINLEREKIFAQLNIIKNNRL